MEYEDEDPPMDVVDGAHVWLSEAHFEALIDAIDETLYQLRGAARMASDKSGFKARIDAIEQARAQLYAQD